MTPGRKPLDPEFTQCSDIKTPHSKQLTYLWGAVAFKNCIHCVMFKAE